MGARRNRSTRNTTTRAVDCIRRLVNALGESARTVEQRTGITNAQLFLLRQLHREKELTINELAARALTQQSTVSLLVRRLEAAGLVTRARSPSDGRRVCVTLTARGKTTAARAPEPPIARMLRGLDTMRESDLEALIRGVGALLATMRVPAGAAAPLFENDTARRLRAVEPTSNRRPHGSRR
jgi:DNA-binding MarR family transcriptional regulator